jgi:hypothetical protein
MSATIKPHSWSIERLLENEHGEIIGTERPSQPLFTREDLVRVAAGATVCPIGPNVMVSDHAEMLVAYALGEVPR